MALESETASSVADQRLDPSLFQEVSELYATYAACLDDGPTEDWPTLFIDDCRYELIPRENFDRGLPLATLLLESRGMLRDRIFGATQTLYHAPYYQRHIIGPLRARVCGDRIHVDANYLVIRTKRSEPSEILNAGRYCDQVVRENRSLRFAVKRCIFDSELIPNSIIYPL